MRPISSAPVVGAAVLTREQVSNDQLQALPRLRGPTRGRSLVTQSRSQRYELVIRGVGRELPQAPYVPFCAPIDPRDAMFGARVRCALRKHPSGSSALHGSSE
jgi:hypothetical protein